MKIWNKQLKVAILKKFGFQVCLLENFNVTR
jgi:hypothetical protein